MNIHALVAFWAIFAIWALMMLADAIESLNYDPPSVIHPLLMLAAGFIFHDAVRDKKGGTDGGTD